MIVLHHLPKTNRNEGLEVPESPFKAWEFAPLAVDKSLKMFQQVKDMLMWWTKDGDKERFKVLWVYQGLWHHLWPKWKTEWGKDSPRSTRNTPRASRVLPVAENLPDKAEGVRDADWSPGSGRSPGGGHGNPLQYSWPENPMDRGAWQATVHSVTKRHSWLKQLSNHIQNSTESTCPGIRRTNLGWWFPKLCKLS